MALLTESIELETATLKELAVLRPDLVEAIKAGEDEIRFVVNVQKDDEGRIIMWMEEQRDMDGILIGRRVDEYSYYKTGEIDVITQSVYDSEGTLLSEKEIKHFRDGRQPIVGKSK